MWDKDNDYLPRNCSVIAPPAPPTKFLIRENRLSREACFVVLFRPEATRQ
jgi:hypothetical protein